MEAKVRELQELKRMREELEGEITALEDAVKADMGQREEVVVGPPLQGHLEARHEPQN